MFRGCITWKDASINRRLTSGMGGYSCRYAADCASQGADSEISFYRMFIEKALSTPVGGRAGSRSGRMEKLGHDAGSCTPEINGLSELACFGPNGQTFVLPHWATLGRARPWVRWLSAAEATLEGQLEALDRLHSQQLGNRSFLEWGFWAAPVAVHPQWR